MANSKLIVATLVAVATLKYGISIQQVIKLIKRKRNHLAIIGFVLAFIHSKLPKKNLPSKYPKHYPFIGAALTVPEFLRDWHSTWLKIARQNNFEPFDCIVVEKKIINIFDRNDIKYILKDNFKQYQKNPPTGDGFGSVFEELLGDGIFAVDGEKWKVQRKVASYMFSNSSLRDYVFDVFLKHSEILVEHLQKHKGETFDLQTYWTCFTFDAFCEIAFGYNPCALESAFKDIKPEFLIAFDAAQQISVNRFTKITPIWKTKRFFGIGDEAELKKHIELLDKVVYNMIEQRINDFEAEMKCGEVKRDLLSLFLTQCKDKKEFIEPKFLRDMILNFMIAGRDTTASTLTSFFRFMSENQECEQKLAEEFSTITPKGNQVTVQQLKEAKYADCCFNETVRLFPPVGSDIRFAMKDDVLPSGIKVEKNNAIYVSSYASGRSPKNFENPDSFDPERWNRIDNGAYVSRIPDEYTTPIFMGGPRICLGKEMARMETKLVASMLLREGIRIRVKPMKDESLISGPVLFYQQEVLSTA